MIGDVCDGRTISRNSIRNGWRRVIQILRLHQNIANAEESFLQLGVMNTSGEILKFYRKVRILHLAGKGILKIALECGRSVNVQFGTWNKGGNEKGKSLDMIPVSMTDEKVNPMR